MQQTQNNITEMVSESGISPRWKITSIMFFAAIIIPCLVIFRATYAPWIQSSQNPVSPSTVERIDPSSEEGRLLRVLKKASMDNRTVIFAPLNEAWAAPNSILDLFFESFRIGENINRFLDHLVIVALDQKAYSRCLQVHKHCFALYTGLNSSSEAKHMSPTYLMVVWKKIDFLRSVLELGYNFVFTDADIMWFRDPFPHFTQDADIQVACDRFKGNPDDIKNSPNTGFMYVKSNKQTINFYKLWYGSRNMLPKLHDQSMFDLLKLNDFAMNGLKMRFFDTTYFSGFCQPSKDFIQVCTMHANCCVGLGKKIRDLRLTLDDWKMYLSMKQNMSESSPSWSIPKYCANRDY